MPLRPLNSANSLTQNLSQATDMFRELFDRQTTEIFKDDTGERRVLLGKGANGFYGLRVSKPGEDVYTAADNELIFNSDQNIFKIVSEVNLSITASANTNNTTTYAHGLGYTPAVIGFLNAGLVGGARTPLPTWTSLTRDDANHQIVFRTWINAEVDGTNLYIDFFNSTAGTIGPLTVTLYLLQETAN